MDFLVKYPSRSRPQLFVERVQQYLADPIARMLVTLDHDDDRMNQPDIHAFLDRHEDRVKVRWGNCKTKVEACNDGLNEEPWTGIALLASDDMAPQRPDYASRIVELFTERFPDGDGVLHLHDGRVGKILNTICCCDRKYYDRLGYLYRPLSLGGYASVYCDNEWQEVSEQLGRSAFVNEVVIKHQWIGETAPDKLHQRNESFHTQDARTFRARKAAGFPR
jgi:hypothetical protein